LAECRVCGSGRTSILPLAGTTPLSEGSMKAQQTTSHGRKQVSGMVILALGILVFVPKLGALAPRFGETPETLRLELVNALPAIGLGVLHAGQALAFEPRSFFAGLAGILVSFWPLLLVAAGTLLLRNGFGGGMKWTGRPDSPVERERL
jgi:hypothetical protein